MRGRALLAASLVVSLCAALLAPSATRAEEPDFWTNARPPTRAYVEPGRPLPEPHPPSGGAAIGFGIAHLGISLGAMGVTMLCAIGSHTSTEPNRPCMRGFGATAGITASLGAALLGLGIRRRIRFNDWRAEHPIAATALDVQVAPAPGQLALALERRF